ncbi:MAG: YabP/YqfC family sporulation protein, partial [Clostridia bacterium]|nr:YabP/YqfC family sporulation protein [Clostridia bacterium]
IENGKKILISDCKKILEYSPECIKILLSKELITLIGENLSLYDFFGSEVQVSGNIKALEILSDIDAIKKQRGELSK